MIGLDTNVLIRYLTQDDPDQSAKATRFIEHQLTVHNPGYICLVVMAETAWVLERSYRRTAIQVAEALERLLRAETLIVESEQEVFASIIAMQLGQATFADALIEELGAKVGCDHTVTFDEKASRLPGFRTL